MWSADGKRLFYVSDESGVANVWEKPVSGSPRQLTKFTDSHVLFPSISHDGKTIVFEREFRIWKLDPVTGACGAVEIAVRGTPAGTAATHLSLNTGFRDLTLSPDGKKVAFTAHGEVFAASAKDAGNAARITATAANESQIAWSPDSRRVTYVSRSRRSGAYLSPTTSRRKPRPSAVTSGTALQDSHPVWSPDGTRVAYLPRWPRDPTSINRIRRQDPDRFRTS